MFEGGGAASGRGRGTLGLEGRGGAEFEPYSVFVYFKSLPGTGQLSHTRMGERRWLVR